MRDPLGWVPVKYKLPLTFVSICLVAFGVGGVVVTSTAREALEREIRLRLDGHAASASLILDRHLDLLGRRAEDFASDGFIRSECAAGRRRTPGATRERVGRSLREGRVKRGERKALAAALDVTVRTLRNWQRADPRRPGRPPRAEAERRKDLYAVARAWRRAGRAAGWVKVMAELAVPVPRALVHELLAALKARRARRMRERAERERVSTEVLYRDALGSLDATNVGEGAEAVALRDAGTTATPALSAGPPSTGEDLVHVLEAAEKERGTAPLALAIDNGGPMRSHAMHAWADEKGVVLVYSLPRTPQHNAWSETGLRDLKLEAGIATRRMRPGRGRAEGGADPSRVARIALRLEGARRRIDTRLRRTTRGGLTASALDAAMPRWQPCVDRVAFHDAACTAIREALAVPGTARARRRREREAVLATLERFGLVRRTRGGAPLLPVKQEINS